MQQLHILFFIRWRLCGWLMLILVLLCAALYLFRYDSMLRSFNLFYYDAFSIFLTQPAWEHFFIITGCLFSSTLPSWHWSRLLIGTHYMTADPFGSMKQVPLQHHHFNHGKAPFKLRDAVGQSIGEIQQAALAVSHLRQLRSDTLEKMPHAVLLVDISGKLLLFNPRAALLFASLNQDLADGQELTKLFHGFVYPFDLVGTSIAWSELTAVISGMSPVLLQLQTYDQNQAEYQLNMSVMRSADQRISGYLLLLIDVSSMRQAEQSRDELFQFTSHDMRGIQSSILALLALQNQPKHAVPSAEFMARIEASVTQTLKLAENLVQLEKAQSFHYQWHEIDFLSLVSDVCNQMWPLATAKHIQIVIGGYDEMVWVHAERDLLWRALSNLLSNAIKFSPHGAQINIDINVLQHASPLMLSCVVSDHGVGISECDQTRLFKPFVRVGADHSQGTGLGLAFVKLVAERHHGTIGLSSRLGEGSCFELKLPCMTEPEIV